MDFMVQSRNKSYNNSAKIIQKINGQTWCHLRRSCTCCHADDVALAEVQFDGTKPSPSRSTGSTMPLTWRMVGACLKRTWVALRWVGTSNVAKQMLSFCCYSRSNWRSVGSAPYLTPQSVVWLSGNALASINVVALRLTRLVLGRVTACGRVNHFGM